MTNKMSTATTLSSITLKMTSRFSAKYGKPSPGSIDPTKEVFLEWILI
jgi:hypothetical protein